MVLVSFELEDKEIKMKKIRQIFLILFIFNLVTIGPVTAQNDSRIHNDFRRIEIYMIKVWELVRQFNDSKAIEYMALAKIEMDLAGILSDVTPAGHPDQEIGKAVVVHISGQGHGPAKVISGHCPFQDLGFQVSSATQNPKYHERENPTPHDSLQTYAASISRSCLGENHR